MWPDNSSSSVAQRCQKVGHPASMPRPCAKSRTCTCSIVLLSFMQHPMLYLFFCLHVYLRVQSFGDFIIFIKTRDHEPWLVWLSRLSASLRAKRSPVQFPVREHACVVEPGAQLGACERQLIDVSLTHRCFSPSLSHSLPLSLKINFKKKSRSYDLMLFLFESPVPGVMPDTY